LSIWQAYPPTVPAVAGADSARSSVAQADGLTLGIEDGDLIGQRALGLAGPMAASGWLSGCPTLSLSTTSNRVKREASPGINVSAAALTSIEPAAILSP
jgi:hypothetical protein